MTVRLVVRQRGEAQGADNNPSEHLLEDALITIGRDPACQVVLAQKAVSRNHTRITRDGALFFVEDLGSAYGTQVNGQVLPKGEKRLLRNGDIIAIAQFDLAFDKMQAAPKEGNGKSEKTAFVARQAVKDLMRGIGGGPGEAPFLRIMNGTREGERIELPEAQELVVGRDEEADVTIQDDLASRRHAKIRRDWSGTHVEDLGSRNGIRVNRKKFSRRTLKDKDELEIGGTRMLFVDPNAAPEEAPPASELSGLSEGTRNDEESPQAEQDAPPDPVHSDAPESPPPPEESEPEPALENEEEGSNLDDGEAPPPEEEEAPEEDEAPKPFFQDREKQKRVALVAVIGLMALAVVGIVIAVFAGA